MGEVHILILFKIQKFFQIFPSRETAFNLEIPTGGVFIAKVCQVNSKALMINPNKAISGWLLRKFINLQEVELKTIERMNQLGLDSVII